MIFIISLSYRHSPQLSNSTLIDTLHMTMNILRLPHFLLLLLILSKRKCVSFRLNNIQQMDSSDIYRSGFCSVYQWSLNRMIHHWDIINKQFLLVWGWNVTCCIDTWTVYFDFSPCFFFWFMCVWANVSAKY